MTTTNWLKIAVAALILVFVFAACSSPSDTENTGIGIKGVSWRIDNMDETYLGEKNVRARIHFFIYFETPGPTANDIASVYIKSLAGNIWWEFDDPTDMTAAYDAEGNYFLGWVYSTSLSDNSSVLPIGTYNFTVTYSDGSVAKSSLLVPAPGATVAGSTSYVYTEDYTNASSPPSGYAALPRRAENITAVRSASELTIKFSVTDDKIYNGYVWFYDSEKAYIGKTNRLRDFDTGLVSSVLDNGKLHNDGTENTLVLSDSDFELKTGKDMSDIDSFFIVLTDGRQYASNGNRYYDTRSISQRVSVTTN